MIAELKDVRFAYEATPVLGGVSLSVRAGERIAILGANGSGKSTLLDLLLGLASADGGEVRVPSREHVGFVPQEPAASLLPWFRVRDNIALPLRARGLTGEGCTRAVGEVHARLDPDARIDLDAYPHTLSGGQGQMVALMRGLVGRPKLLLCDEPLSALDAPARVRLRRAIRAACEAGPALILVSHDIDDVMDLTDRALVLRGRPAQISDRIDLRAEGGHDALHRALGQL